MENQENVFELDSMAQLEQKLDTLETELMSIEEKKKEIENLIH